MPIYLDLSILSVLLGVIGIILYFWGREKNRVAIKQKERLENITQTLRGIYNSLTVYAEAKNKDISDLAVLIRKQLNGVIGSSSKIDEKEKEEEEDNKKNGKTK
ncbi:hypothetical protein KAS41_02740 [Candidatus Parcubacteria bacterium]|nr:hypothetical protein [Candidatus Parcubacteria bacterium]